MSDVSRRNRQVWSMERQINMLGRMERRTGCFAGESIRQAGRHATSSSKRSTGTWTNKSMPPCWYTHCQKKEGRVRRLGTSAFCKLCTARKLHSSHQSMCTANDRPSGRSDLFLIPANYTHRAPVDPVSLSANEVKKLLWKDRSV